MQRLKIIASAVAAIACTTALHAQDVNSTAGALFVATNNAKGNEVVMYDRSAKGVLTKVGNFPTGGRGQGGVNDPLQSSYSVLLSPDHSYLLVVNSGSSDISVFHVLPDGLALASVTPSGGGNPVSLAMYDDLVYVSNAGGTLHTAGFRLTNNGELKPVANSKKTPTSLDPGAGTIGFFPGGSKLILLERITNKIDVFTVNPDGSLTDPVFNSAQGVLPFGFTFTPTGSLLVAEAGSGAVSSYTVEANNSITPISSKVKANGGATCWVVTNGTYAWSSNSTTSSLSLYSVTNAGTLSFAGIAATLAATEPTIFPNVQPATSYPLDLALSGDNKFLYTFYSGNGVVVGYKVGEGGKLTPVTSVSPEKAQVGAEGLAVY